MEALSQLKGLVIKHGALLKIIAMSYIQTLVLPNGGRDVCSAVRSGYSDEEPLEGRENVSRCRCADA